MQRYGGHPAIRRRPPKAVEVGNICALAAGRRSRVCAQVDGELLWFESDDVPLRPQAEAFGCVALPAAIEHKADLVIDAPVDAIWSTNVKALQEVWRHWWRIRRAGIHPQAEEKRPFVKALGVALCFGGGVDSFYSLLRGPLAIDHLVFVQGYDIKLSDFRRADAAERSLREVAAAVGAKAVVVRTNLREHPTFAATNWERTHGGALAAVGHLLSHQIGSLVISSSYPYYHDTPWGSHWRTDPLWSSAQSEIVHYGAWLWRKEKLESMAGARVRAIFTRDPGSFAILQTCGLHADIATGLSHDPALYLRDSELIRTHRQAATDDFVLAAFRNDLEGTNSLQVQLGRWAGLVPLRVRRRVEGYGRRMNRQNQIARAIRCTRSTKPLRVCDVSHYPFPYFLETIRSADEVHTDRLHVMLLAAMLGKPTFAYPTTFRKLESVYEHSMKDWACVEFVRTP